MDSCYQNRAVIFKALGDENRWKILDILKGGEKCACVLMDRLEMGQSAVSYHMKILCESGIVESRQEGKWMHYQLSEAGSQYALELLKQITTPDFA